MENVVMLSFKSRGVAREALAGLQRIDHEGRIGLEAVALIERTPNHRIIALEDAEDAHLKATAAGGLIGAVVGLLSGPFGLVLGGASGAVVGYLVDIADVESSEQLLRKLGQAVPPGRTAAIAVVGESSPDAIDALASDLGVAVLRRSRGEVETGIATADTAALADGATKTIGERVRDVKDGLVHRH